MPISSIKPVSSRNSDNMLATLSVAGNGMRAQSIRLRTIAENMANKDSTTISPDVDPYRRKTTHFKNVFNRTLNADLVEVSAIRQDLSPFNLIYDPNHPAANEFGYVKKPNVNPLIELMDMREAMRSYEANLNVQKSARSMVIQTLDIIR